MLHTNLKAIGDAIQEWRRDHGFYTPASIGDFPCPIQLTEGDAMLGKLALVHSEVSEAVEAVRKGDQANFEEEIADIFIRLLDITATVGINIEAAVGAKMAKNELRPIKHSKITTI